MKTLAVCYSRTGTTKKVAEAILEKLDCDLELLEFDEKTKMITVIYDPADYDQVIILSPIWAFTLSGPMKRYLLEYHEAIKAYYLVVTCGGLGLYGCVRFCWKTMRKPPEVAVKLRARDVNKGDIQIEKVLRIASGLSSNKVYWRESDE